MSRNWKQPSPFLVYASILSTMLVGWLMWSHGFWEPVPVVRAFIWVMAAYIWVTGAFLFMLPLGLLGLIGAETERKFWVGNGVVEGFHCLLGPDAVERYRAMMRERGLQEAARSYRNVARWIAVGILLCLGLSAVLRPRRL